MTSTALTAADVIARARRLVQPALRRAVADLEDERMRRIASYQLGWCDADGRPTDNDGGKSVRATLAILSAEAGGGPAEDGIPGAVAVELVHNFSLLHDDVMDGDLQRRHRPTGWAAFGTSPAILAGNAMLTEAVEVLVRAAGADTGALQCLLTAVQRLISGQSDDLRFEKDPRVGIQDVLHMEAGKTAALLECASSIGARAVGAPPDAVDALHRYGHHVGMAFQLVDDVLGITGDPAVTGKSASSDLRAGKRSAPVVAALEAGTAASEQLARIVTGSPPRTDEEAAAAAQLVVEAGGIAWAHRAADEHLRRALRCLDDAPLARRPAHELALLAEFVVNRNR